MLISLTYFMQLPSLTRRACSNSNNFYKKKQEGGLLFRATRYGHKCLSLSCYVRPCQEYFEVIEAKDLQLSTGHVLSFIQ